MTEPLDVAIAQALRLRLTTASAPVGGTPRAAPLKAYTPTDKITFLAIHPLMRAAPEHRGLSFGDSDMLRGIFQVDVVTADNAGEDPGTRLASAIAARFPMGLELTANGVRVQITKPPTLAAAVKDAPWVRFPVSIPYLVIT